MALLTALVEDSLDEGYAAASARREGSGDGPRGRVVLTVGLLAVGLLLATAAVQTRQRSSGVAEARSALIAEIEDRQQATDRLEASLQRSREEVSAQRRATLRLTARGAALERTLSRLEAATGVGAVAGPGMVLRLEDAERPPGADTDPRTQSETEGRVTDRDLQTLVNEIWAAGAEAVAVNGQRLTAMSSIRAAGEAILVDFRPLVPPYEVEAVGPASLRTRFVSGFGGSYLQVLRDYGITYNVSDRDELVLPASAGVTLRYARPLDPVGSASTTSPASAPTTSTTERDPS